MFAGTSTPIIFQHHSVHRWLPINTKLLTWPFFNGKPSMKTTQVERDAHRGHRCVTLRVFFFLRISVLGFLPKIGRSSSFFHSWLLIDFYVSYRTRFLGRGLILKPPSCHVCLIDCLSVCLFVCLFVCFFVCSVWACFLIKSHVHGICWPAKVRLAAFFSRFCCTSTALNGIETNQQCVYSEIP